MVGLLFNTIFKKINQIAESLTHNSKNVENQLNFLESFQADNAMRSWSII